MIMLLTGRRQTLPSRAIMAFATAVHDPDG